MTSANDGIHAEVGRRLRSRHLVYTRGRRQLIDALLDIGHPASVPQLVKHRSKLTQSSIYRNLADLEGAGVVHKVAGSDDHARYELDEHFIGHHHHLICIKCGVVADFVVPTDAERTINSTLAKAAKQGGFRLTGHRFDALGLCKRCK
ncbi:MAG: Fur family transcriptional regulator [Actinomycetota bacterium]